MGKIMSEEPKYELAEGLGFPNKVKDGDLGNITTREAESLVKRAVEKTEERMAQQNKQ